MKSIDHTAAPAHARRLLLGLALLMLAACGGGGGGSGNGGGTIPPPPPPVIEPTDDVFVGVLSGMPSVLSVLDNDRPGEQLVSVSRSRVGSDIAIDGTNILYTSPSGFVGEDGFYYITENSNGEQTRSEVALRVDQVSSNNDPAAAPAPLAAAAADGPYAVEYELYGGIDLITHTTTIQEADFGQLIRVDGIPSPTRLEGAKQGHLVSARLRAGVRYLISFELFMDRESEVIPPLIWSEYPQSVVTDSYSVPLYDDLCIYYEDWVWGNFWACHTNQTGVERLIGHVFEPKVTDDYNIYLWSEIYELDSKLVVLCEEVPNFGCGYNVMIEELDDNTSTRQNASIAIGGSPVHGSIETTADSDWFTMNAYATETTIINVYPEQDAKGEQLDDFLVQLWVDGQIVAYTAPTGGVATLEHVATGDHSLRVGIESLGGQIGGYRIESAGGDVPSDTNTFAGMEVGEIVDGQINNGRDAGDWFKVYLTANVPYEASITTSIADIENAFIGLRDVRGDAVWTSRQNEDLVCNPGCEYTHRVSFTLVRSGYYFLMAAAPEPQQSGHYQLALMERQDTAPDDDLAGDATTIGRAQSMVPSHGVLESAGDVDWFRFISAFGGEQRTFFVDGAFVLNGLFEYPTITVVHENGNVVATGEVWKDGVQRVAMTTTQSGNYYLTVSGDGTHALPYTVHNSPGDPAGNRDSWAYIGLCTEVHQSISRAADLDWYNIELQADKTYTFEIASDEQGYTAATRPRVSLYTESGNFMGSVTAVDASAWLVIDIAAAGRYFLEVNNNSGRIGGYRLLATDESEGECD
ncbi:MAG: hypothetical protein RIA65_11755 [Woeseia sp.]